MFNQRQRALEMEKKLAGLTEQVELLTQNVTDLTGRCAALEAQHEADSERLETICRTLKSLSERADLTERFAALEAQHEVQHEAHSERLEEIGQTLKSLSKRVDWEAEQVHHTATAIMEQIRHGAKNSREL